jgi:hypothetical protein
MKLLLFNSYLFTLKLNGPKAKYKVTTSKEKQPKHAQTKYEPGQFI